MISGDDKFVDTVSIVRNLTLEMMLVVEFSTAIKSIKRLLRQSLKDVKHTPKIEENILTYVAYLVMRDLNETCLFEDFQSPIHNKYELDELRKIVLKKFIGKYCQILMISLEEFWAQYVPPARVQINTPVGPLEVRVDNDNARGHRF